VTTEGENESHTMADQLDGPAWGGGGDKPMVHFFWRPGCPFCAVLRHRLERLGITVNPINIWEDADAASFVRSVAGGNETVPTVAIGDSALVNPPPRAVQALLAEVTSGLPAAEG
jgi:mycoredoxin